MTDNGSANGAVPDEPWKLVGELLRAHLGLAGVMQADLLQLVAYQLSVSRKALMKCLKAPETAATALPQVFRVAEPDQLEKLGWPAPLDLNPSEPASVLEHLVSRFVALRELTPELAQSVLYPDGHVATSVDPVLSLARSDQASIAEIARRCVDAVSAHRTFGLAGWLRDDGLPAARDGRGWSALVRYCRTLLDAANTRDPDDVTWSAAAAHLTMLETGRGTPSTETLHYAELLAAGAPEALDARQIRYWLPILGSVLDLERRISAEPKWTLQVIRDFFDKSPPASEARANLAQGRFSCVPAALLETLAHCCGMPAEDVQRLGNYGDSRTESVPSATNDDEDPPPLFLAITVPPRDDALPLAELALVFRHFGERAGQLSGTHFMPAQPEEYLDRLAAWNADADVCGFVGQLFTGGLNSDRTRWMRQQLAAAWQHVSAELQRCYVYEDAGTIDPDKEPRSLMSYQDVAMAAGCSTAAVSGVLTGRGQRYLTSALRMVQRFPELFAAVDIDELVALSAVDNWVRCATDLPTGRDLARAFSTGASLTVVQSGIPAELLHPKVAACAPHLAVATLGFPADAERAATLVQQLRTYLTTRRDLRLQSRFLIGAGAIDAVPRDLRDLQMAYLASTQHGATVREVPDGAALMPCRLWTHKDPWASSSVVVNWCGDEVPWCPPAGTPDPISYVEGLVGRSHPLLNRSPSSRWVSAPSSPAPRGTAVRAVPAGQPRRS